MAEMPKVHIKPFHGRGGQNASGFLDLYKRMCNIYKLKDEEQAEMFPLYIEQDSPASTWYHSQREAVKNKYTDLSEAFLRRFEPTVGMRQALCRELKNREYTPGEDIEGFVDDIVRRGRILGLSEQSIMDQVLLGLPEEVANTISQYDPKTVEDIIRRARYCSLSRQNTINTTAAVNTTAPPLQGTTQQTGSEVQQLVAAVGQLLKDQVSVISDTVKNIAQMSVNNVQMPQGYRQGHDSNHQSEQYQHKGYVQNGQYQHYNGQSHQGPQQRQNQRNDMSNSRCRHCGKYNHYSNECYFQMAVCNICKRQGHIVAVCYHKHST